MSLASIHSLSFIANIAINVDSRNCTFYCALLPCCFYRPDKLFRYKTGNDNFVYLDNAAANPFIFSRQYRQRSKEFLCLFW